jgi:hypothetical protein
MPGSAMLYFMLRANFCCSKMHPPRIYCSKAFGSVAGGAGQAATIGFTSHGTIFVMMHNRVKVVASNNMQICLRHLIAPVVS